MKEDKLIFKQAVFLAQMLLDDYSDWLHKKGYIDSDYYAEKPKAVESFIKEYFKSNHSHETGSNSQLTHNHDGNEKGNNQIIKSNQ